MTRSTAAITADDKVYFTRLFQGMLKVMHFLAMIYITNSNGMFAARITTALKVVASIAV